jgi:quinol monooxygenase YgiN
MIRITVIWVLGIVTLVPYAVYRLLFVAQPDEYAFLIVFPLFWVFGFWGVVGPLFAAVKAHRLLKALEAAHGSVALQKAFQENEGDDVIVDLIRSENRIPKWLARGIFDRVKPRLLAAIPTTKESDMSTAVSWNLQLAVQDGRLDDFRSLMHEMVESTRAEDGAQAYEWFVSEDGTACHLYERYADSGAAMVHLATFGSRFAERFLSCVAPTGFYVYGDPSDEVRAVLGGFGAAYLGPFGGFAR